MRKIYGIFGKILLCLLLLGCILIPMGCAALPDGGTDAPGTDLPSGEGEVYESRIETDVRLQQTIDPDWKFIRQDVSGAEGVDFDDSAWRTLNLPHDWSIEGEYDQSNPAGGSGGYLPTGIGWYRKTLTVPKEWQGKQVTLEFDGVFCNSTVYADGEKVGGREYGWLSFSCDITAQVQGKESVVIAVRVDNSVQPAARWYTGSGIYSHVRVIATDPVSVAEHGTQITTPHDDKGVPTGAAEVTTVLQNRGQTDAPVTLRATVFRRSDHAEVAREITENLTVPAGKTLTVSQELSVENPLLWNTETPHLYYLRTEILSGETVLDDFVTVFGFRAITYAVNGFFLNGENIELKGVANHWALGALGAAQSTNMIRYKIQMMKDMGVNCIRTAHNACPPEFYDLCDEMGMMVMDEFSEGERGKVAGDYGTRWFSAHWKEDVEYWVKRDRNHPSVVVWSIGNEIGSSNDNTGISAHIKKFDTSRPTTGSAIHTGVDIPGANGQSESGSFKQPIADLPLIATEAPHTHAVRGVYRTQTWRRGTFSASGAGNNIPNLTETEIFRYDWSADAVGARIWPSDYDNAVSQTSARRHWVQTRDKAWRVGEFRWTGFDYLGEANYVLGGWPYRMFHSGAVDTALFEKDLYYLYQSMWTDSPMLHILPSWTHPIMEEGTEIPVWVYSNCETVELFLNGKSLGKEKRGPMDRRGEFIIQFDWLVPYAPGTLTAVGYDKDGKEILRESCTTASAPAAITLKNTTGESLPVDPAWVGQVTVTTVDKDGNFYPYGENRAYYAVVGPAYVKAADNGNPTDTESHVKGNRNAFMGLNKVFVSPTGEEGDILLIAGSILGEKRQLTSDLVHIDVEQIALRGKPAEEKFEIYYTLDGSVPGRSSAKYTGAFKVSPETSVKAAVYRAGQDAPLFVMEEAFGADEGMYWAGTGSSAASDCVVSAENAEIGSGMKKVSYGYEEKYITFNNKAGFAEYTVTAPAAGEYYVAVCYNNGSGSAGKSKAVTVSVNGASLGEHPFRYNGAWEKFWSYHILSVTLKEGENKIRFESSATAGPNLKELLVFPADGVYTGDEAELTGDDEVLSHESAFDDGAVDVHSGGTVTWTVIGKTAGEYDLYFWYSTPNGSLRQVSGSVNGEQIAVWAGQKVSPDYGSSWGYCKTRVSLAPGVNVISVTAPTGGTLIGAVSLVSVKTYPLREFSVEASCLPNLRLGASGSAPVLGSAPSSWQTVTNSEGNFWLVDRSSGKLLTSDGTSLALSSGETGDNAQWQRVGEAEHYDYLVHVASGKVLAVDASGKLILAARENYNDFDMISNRAFWRLTSST